MHHSRMCPRGLDSWILRKDIINMRLIIHFIFVITLQVVLITTASAEELDNFFEKIEARIATAFYSKEIDQKKLEMFDLIINDLEQANLDSKRQQAEMNLWKGIAFASRAKFMGFNPDALKVSKHARDLLEKSVHLNSRIANGMALVNLGILYTKAPERNEILCKMISISGVDSEFCFGDKEKAKKCFGDAAKINDKTMDYNFLYAQYLIEEEKKEELARTYLDKAKNTPLRSNQIYADTQLRNEIEQFIRDNY